MPICITTRSNTKTAELRKASHMGVDIKRDIEVGFALLSKLRL